MATLRTRGLLVAAFLAASFGMHASYRHTVHTPVSDLQLKQVVVDSVTYVEPVIDGYYNAGVVGEPSLPLTTICVSVPYNAENFTIIYNTNDSASIKTEVPLYRNPIPVTSNGKVLQLSDLEKDVPVDSQPVKLMGVSFIGGINKVVKVGISPFCYKEEDNSLLCYSSIDVTLNWSIGAADESLTPVYSSSESERNSATDRVKELVLNPNEVEANAYQPVQTRTLVVEDYEYIIVTSQELAPYFERLASLRRLKGYSSKVFTMESILTNPLFSNGDVVSRINDDAGKLRAFLSYAYSNYGTRFVLLGGKPPHVPIRYGHSDNYGPEQPEDNECVIPTDLYFGELNSSWNLDNDEYFGELEDNIEFDCELYVGRLLCTTPNEVNNYIDKLEIYELNPGNGNPDYLNRALINVYKYEKRADKLRPITGMEYSFNKYLKTHYNDIFPSLDLIYSQLGFPSGTTIVQRFNIYQYGFMDMVGHGSPEGVGTCLTPNTQYMQGLFSITGITKSLRGEYPCALDNIENKYYPFWSYSISCTTMPFDTYIEIDGDSAIVYDARYNFGESMTLGKDYGGVAYLGNTRDGWNSTSFVMASKFFDILKERNANMPFDNQLGLVEAFSKSKMAQSNNPMTDLPHHVILTHNIMGDPAITVWMQVPHEIGILNTYSMDYGYNMFGLDGESALHAKMDFTSHHAASREPLNVANLTNYTLEPNIAHTIYGPGIIPFTMPLEFQNAELHGIHTIKVSEFECGSFANPNWEDGPVYITEDADISVTAKSRISILNGTIIENGGVLRLTCKNPVDISGIVVMGGGTLIINAPDVKLGKGVKFEKGARVFIQNKISI